MIVIKGKNVVGFVLLFWGKLPNESQGVLFLLMKVRPSLAYSEPAFLNLSYSIYLFASGLSPFSIFVYLSSLLSPWLAV